MIFKQSEKIDITDFLIIKINELSLAITITRKIKPGPNEVVN